MPKHPGHRLGGATDPGGASGSGHSRPNEPIEDLVLTEVVPGAMPAHLADVPLPGVSEIPIVGVAARVTTRSEPGRVRGESRSPRDLLAQTPLFGPLDGAALGELTESARLVRLGEGQILFREGDRGDALYVVVEGAVVPVAEGQPRTRLAVLETGAFFGEIGLVTDEPRTATIEALVDTTLLAIDRPVLWKTLRHDPRIFGVLFDSLRERLIERLVRTSAFFEAFALDHGRDVARLFRFLELESGSVVIQQGQKAPALCVVLAGTLRVIRMEPDGDQELAVLNPGSVFGEMSLLEGVPAMASVLARGKCWVLALPAVEFRRSLARSPHLAQLLLDLARQRDRENRDLYNA